VYGPAGPVGGGRRGPPPPPPPRVWSGRGSPLVIQFWRDSVLLLLLLLLVMVIV
jgi:hypothetical protein